MPRRILLPFSLLLVFACGFFCRDAFHWLNPADVSEAAEDDDDDGIVYLRFYKIPASIIETVPEVWDLVNRDQLCTLDPMETFFVLLSLNGKKSNVVARGPPRVFLNTYHTQVTLYTGEEAIHPFDLGVYRRGSVLNLTIDGRSCSFEHEGGCLFRVGTSEGPVIFLVTDAM